MASYPWNDIKAKYETGKFSMKELADEYGFNASYAARKARDEGWEKGKTKKIVQKNSVKRCLKEIVQDETKLRKENLQMVQYIKYGAMEEVIKDDPDFNRMKTFKIATEIMQNIKGLEWDLLQFVDDTQNKEDNDSLIELAKTLNQMRSDNDV